MSHIQDYILKTLGQYFNRPKLELTDKAEESLSEFVYNSQIILLQAFMQDDDILAFHTTMQNNRKSSIIFYKSSHQDLDAQISTKDINIVTLSNNVAESLYQVVKHVYSPLLASGDDLYSSKLQKNMSDMVSILSVLTHDKENGSNVLSSIDDEIEFWRLLGEKRDISKKEKESANSFTAFFEDVLHEIRSMQSGPLNEAREVVENIGGLLDDVWRYTLLPYPRERMTQIFDIIGHIICVMIQKSLSPLNLWKALGEPSDTTILTHLSVGLKVIEMWSSVCQSLTETYWPNYALHAWTDKPYIPSFCTNFQSRLKEVCDIRSTYSQLNKLLNFNERMELKTEQLFEPFENVNVWACSGPNVSWETALSRFSANLRPVETKIAEKLRPRLHNVSTKQILYEFLRYKTLVCRPVIKRALNSELEAFVSSLMSTLRTIRGQVDSEDVSDGMFQPPETSPLVQQVQWAKKTEAKVKEIQMCAESDLKEFEGSAELMKMSAQLLKDLKTMYTQLHEEWCRDLQAQLKSGKLEVSAEKPVVEFSSSSQLMVVNFEPRLAWREAEARALAALGLPAPAPAATALHALDRLLVHARALQQVASFHNTLGERMIPSCRPMMLEAALHLSALVRDQRALYWDDTDQLANYTNNLKNAVSNIEAQNTYLTSQHVAIRNIVEQLANTELLAKQSEWKKKIKDIVDIIEKVESNGYKNTELWRTHWDWQLYKALECQYIRTLLSLHKHFPHVTVDLVLRGHTVRVQPPLEEVRAQHYHQLRRLVALPAHFVGLQRTPHNATAAPVDFGLIVEKHGWLGNKAVARVEAVLGELERACGAWTRRAALASVADLDALCAEHLREPQHWEANFKACKAYGQAVAKMTFEDEKIGWITVGTAGLRREFEAQTRNLWASLMSSLQTSCRNDNTDIEAFIANVHVMMENKTLPKNAKELAEISAQQRALRDKMPEIEMQVEALKRKGHMLRTWGGDASVDGIVREWHRVRDNMNTHQQMFEHQAEIVKSSLNGDWANLNSAVEGWTSRWRQTRARHEDTRASYRDMLDRCQAVFDAQAQCSHYVHERDQLMKECEKFDMKLEINDTWQEMERMITEDVNNWTVLKEYSDELEKLSSQEWVVFQNKLHLLDEFVSTWRSRLEPYTTLTLFIQQEIDKYTDLTSLLKYLRGSDFTERHWREVFNLLEMEYKKPDTLQFMDFLSVATNIRKNIKALQKISASASSEAAVRSALNELELWFAGARLTLAYHTDKAKRTTPIVTDYKDLLAKIEEQQWVVSSVDGGGAGNGSGGDACTAWEARLRQVRRLLRAAHHAQRRWLYLEPILSNDDGDLGVKFKKVDQGFRQVTKILESDARLSALLQSARLQSMLDTISEQLQACQSELNQYIDEKRTVFPRFYFLSDDDLLELLGQARAGAEGREAVMQTHLKKLFPGITGVKLGPGDLSITALCSQFGETFQLDHPIDIDCPVEIWLRNLETEMRSSLKNMTLKCVVTNELQDQDPFSLPTQILCLAQNIRFTEQAERAISSKELHKLKSNIEKEYSYYGSTEVEDECERHKRQALILQSAYYMALVKTLIDNNITSTNDWLWQKQLRFYLLNTKEVEAKMGLAQISYSYEYLGVTTGQFVRTELADECFFILTQSLHLGFVGNPFGPAGTGKTESVKALGGLVGRLVLVFNCDEAMDAECMGRLLTGLALCGAWGCFDEFNRLTADTLAAQTHQLAALLDAMQQRKPGTPATALLNKKQVEVSEWCGVAATLNPAGRGYGGRRELPPALQRLLRPVAMLQPRGEALASHLLAARCIPDATLLATDLNNVFMLASTLLSGERHYDWGLRALKAVVGSLGSAASCATEVSARRAALRRVLTLNNISKLTARDSQRFQNILSMVFADVPDEETARDPISSVLESTVKTLGLVHNDLQLQKCLELHEQLQQRMGVVIVGPPGSGKTTIRRILKSALTQQGKNIVEYTICPKAMSRRALLGHIEQDTRQWTDGVLSTTAADVVNQPADVWCWVVCDGDIDPEWVEALNSVLDDNRLLTLPSGWRIQFAHNVNFLFETHSLEHASPATISRMGIILFSDDVSCASEVLQSWIKNAEFENESAKMALPLLEQVATKCMQWFTSHRFDLAVKIYNITLVKQIVTQFEYCVQNKSSTDYSCAEELVYLAVHNSVSGLIKENAVDTFYREACEGMGASDVTSVVGEWSDALFVSTRLHSCETALRAVVNSPNAHLLIIGPDACGKNLLAEYVLKESNSTVITIDCTPILEPEDIILELKRNNVVRSGGRGAGKGARVTIYVRSLHRAETDDWGSCAVHAFLLQLINESGFWARGGGGGAEGSEGGMQWWSTPRMRVVATANSLVTTSRFAAVCSLVLVPEPDDEELVQLIKKYLLQNVGKNIEEKNIPDVAGKILAMYKEITETFYSRPHYKWNASHLRSLCENVKWYTPKNMTDLITSLQSEANMIFRERLVTDDEKNEFNTISKKYLKGGNSEEIIFATKLRGDGVYMEAVNYKTWCQDAEKLINQCLSEDGNVFGEAGAEVCAELALFWPAIAKTTRGGVAACVSSAGAGRRAAARLAAAALPATLLFVDQEKQFKNQLKNAISSSAEGQRTLIVVGEGAVTSRCLGSLEAMRRAASLPTHLAPAQRSSNTEQNVKENLGIVLCVDKDREDLWKLFEKYPFLYNEGHVVWVDAWSSQTVREMPRAVVRRLIKENVHEDSNELLETVPVEGFVSIYNSIESVVKRAPIRYLNFIHAYYHIVCKKKETLLQRRNMLNAGVEALRRARAEVATLQEEAATQEELLSEKQAAANHALDQIGATVRANTDKKDEMHALKKNIQLENEKLQIRKKEIEVELASVEPVIAAARAAVGDIRPESLSEIRSLRAPPDVVRDVLEGVLRLMGIADTSWHSMKNFLSKRGVKEDIRCLDASQISPEAAAAVRRLLSSRGASFQESAAKRASAACAPLAAWVRANLHYAEALARVAPLQAQQQQLHKSLREAEEQMAGLSSGLETVEQRVEALKAQLGQHTRDAATLELKLQHAADTLNAARHLLEQLAHEYTTWAHDLENISKEISELNIRSLLAAAYIVYLPELTEPQAREYLNKWSSLIAFEDSSFSVINFLSTPETQLKWDADGLPADDTAVKNAVLIEQFVLGPRCGARPLIVDPEGEALTWLRRTLPTSRCDFLSQQSETLHTALQYAHRLGRVVVVTEIESATDVEALRCDARLLLHTRDAELPARLQPHCAASLGVLHFTARLDGLTDQLVNYALQQQNPEMNEKSKEIKLQKATLQKQQHELQENVLRELCSNSDILKDSSLLASLEATRATGATIEAALSEARAVEDARRDACAAYRAGARAAATLALAARSLYPAALPADALLDVFADALASDPSANKSLESLNINHNQIVQYTTKRIIERVLLSVHKKDKHIVALYLLRAVYSDVIKDQLWNIFLGNYDVVEDQNASVDLKKLSPWIKEEFIERIVQIKMTSEDLFNKLSVKDEKLWNEFQNISDANAFSCFKLSGFETVAAAAALRPDILYSVMLTFLETMLGAGAMEAGGAVAGAAKWAGRAMAPPRPILLLAAHGADLLAAHAHSSLNKVGVEAGREAWDACLESARGGGWLALEVGASPLTAQLQHFLQHYADRPVEDFSPDFRLWIVCEDRDIPPLISNLCVNVIIEAGAGLRQNAVSTLCAWGPLEGDERMVRAHVALALLHATVQERRAYIPQGWSRWYAWEWGEVSACGRAVRALAARSGRGGGVYSEAIRAISDALYAARVTGAWDRRVLSALVRRTLGEHVYAHAWRLSGCDVRVPYATRLQTCTAALATLPRDDSPALLALPRNCRRTWERAAADRLLAGLRKLESTVSVYRAAEGPTTAKTLPALWKKLMSGCPLVKGDYVVAEPDQQSSEVGWMWWQRVCADEAREAGRTARFVHAAIAAMARRRVHIHQVPEEWQLLWSGPEAPEAYIKEFCFRARAACERLPTNSTHGSLPQEMDLRSFLRPSRVLCALRAQCALALRCGPHALVLTAKWDSDRFRCEGPALTVLGLVVCGAEWREGALHAAAPHSHAHTPAPPLLLTYALQDLETVQVQESFVVPVYESEAREKLLAEISAPLGADLLPEQALLNSIAFVVAPLA